MRNFYYEQYQTFSDKALRLSKNRGQKSLKRGRSIFFRLSFVLASTLTYNCVTGMRFLKEKRFIINVHVHVLYVLLLTCSTVKRAKVKLRCWCPGARFSKVPIINVPVKLLLFTQDRGFNSLHLT